MNYHMQYRVLHAHYVETKKNDLLVHRCWKSYNSDCSSSIALHI